MSKKTEELHAYHQMSWILLEHELIYFYESQVMIDSSWLELRKISDELYDKRLKEYKKLAKKLHMPSERPVGLNLNRPSVSLIKKKFFGPLFDYQRYPHIWPSQDTETDYELTIRVYLEEIENAA